MKKSGFKRNDMGKLSRYYFNNKDYKSYTNRKTRREGKHICKGVI